MNFWSKEKPRFKLSRRRLWCDRIELRKSGQPEDPYLTNEKAGKSLSHLQFDEASLVVSKQIDDDQRVDKHSSRKSAASVVFEPEKHRNSVTVTCDDMKFSKIESVFNAKYVFLISKDQARLFVQKL